MMFPNYGSTGLANVVRLHELLGDGCECWLMPDWHAPLTRYRNRKLWQETFDQFTTAAPRLPNYLPPLAEHMRQTGLALEQEAIWLPLPSSPLPG